MLKGCLVSIRLLVLLNQRWLALFSDRTVLFTVLSSRRLQSGLPLALISSGEVFFLLVGLILEFSVVAHLEVGLFAFGGGSFVCGVTCGLKRPSQLVTRGG